MKRGGSAAAIRTRSSLALAAVVLAACSGGGSRPVPSPASCAPTGTALTITAPGLAFDKDCLATFAGQAFTVTLDNQDAGVAHNILISKAFAPDSPVLFQGDPVTGPKSITYDVSAFDPGTYSFECSLHPGFMHGTFIVANPTS